MSLSGECKLQACETAALARSTSPLAVYVHTPFCPTKCGYCDFNSFAGMEALRDRTTSAICEEIRASDWKGRPAKTVFFGGGTPTHLSAEQLGRLLEAVFAAHPPEEGCEITTEANPGSADERKLASLRSSGFNRISFGAQSFSDADLRRLGRVHTAGQIVSAVRMARDSGFENLNLDLMFALPGQSLEAWKRNLEAAIALAPEHLSLYCLTIEPNTPFYRERIAGRLNQPDEDLQVAMYDLSVETAERSGYAQYEISNFAKPGFECRHNLAYWRGEEYAGYGPGAVGCAVRVADGIRIRHTNVKHPARYCRAVESGEPLWCEWETVDADKRRLESIMLGLRLNEGVSTNDVPLDPVALNRLERKGWIRLESGRAKLTLAGRHWCSQVALELA